MSSGSAGGFAVLDDNEWHRALNQHLFLFRLDRRRGAQRVGGRKPLGCRAGFGGYRTDNAWLAGALPARRLGRFERQTLIRPTAAMDLRHGDRCSLHFLFALWTREMTAALIKQKFNITLAANSVGRLLLRS
jgi:hypothetical protein